MKIYHLLLLLTLCSNFKINAQENTFDSKVQKMLELNGTKSAFETSLDQTIALEKEEEQEGISSGFYESLKKEMKENGYNELLVELIPIYKKHYTELEIDKMIGFLESKVGQKMVQKGPIIMEESMAVGTKVGEQIAYKVNSKFKNIEESKFDLKLNEDCSRFQLGKFESNYKTKNSNGELVETKTIIVRKGDIQSERSNGDGEETELRITWISDCRYELMKIKADGTNDTTQKMEFNIYEMEGNSYKYIANVIGTNFFHEGEIIKIE